MTTIKPADLILLLSNFFRKNLIFEERYDEPKRMVYNLAHHYVQIIQDAEKITQGVFVSVSQSLAGFKETTTISTGIHRMAINKSLDYIKSKIVKGEWWVVVYA